MSRPPIVSCLQCAHLSRTEPRQHIAHVVAQHPANVPDYQDPECSKCAEFRRALDPDAAHLLPPTIRSMLYRLSAEHRVEAHMDARRVA